MGKNNNSLAVVNSPTWGPHAEPCFQCRKISDIFGGFQIHFRILWAMPLQFFKLSVPFCFQSLPPNATETDFLSLFNSLHSQPWPQSWLFLLSNSLHARVFLRILARWQRTLLGGLSSPGRNADRWGTVTIQICGDSLWHARRGGLLVPRRLDQRHSLRKDLRHFLWICRALFAMRYMSYPVVENCNAASGLVLWTTPLLVCQNHRL